MNNLPMRINLNYLDESISSLPWLKHDSNQRKGAEIAKLYQNGAQKIALVRFHPGAYAEAHIHNGFESILVLEGEYSDSGGHYDRQPSSRRKTSANPNGKTEQGTGNREQGIASALGRVSE